MTQNLQSLKRKLKVKNESFKFKKRNQIDFAFFYLDKVKI